MMRSPVHISVCICTYKRPQLLAHLLSELQKQTTDQLFIFSIIVVDNDSAHSAQKTVEAFREVSLISIEYCSEPEQNIALARNRAVQNAKGDFIALIDDDEIPANNWLMHLYATLVIYNADGVLGPVIPSYQVEPPQWIIRGRFYERPTHTTGTILKWQNTRTGNVLIKRAIFNKKSLMFDPAFGMGGEDRDFFRRMINDGFFVVWCNEAPVYEAVPKERMTRSFMLKRALLRGTIPHFKFIHYILSLIAIPFYTLALPFLLFFGHHIFMKYLIKDFDHIGRIIAAFNIKVIRQKYVIE